MDIIPFINDKNKALKIEVYVNGRFNNKLNFKFEKNSVNKKTRVNFKINKENIINDNINIEFKNLNPVSPYEILMSPDSRKLNFLLLNFNLLKENI